MGRQLLTKKSLNKGKTECALFLRKHPIFIFTQWRPVSHYPLGRVVKAIKTGDNLTNSMEVLFAEHMVKRRFKEETLKEVENKFPSSWHIPDSEYCLRGNILHNVFTIDSLTSKDLDDALSVEVLPNNRYKVGVHISDVSFFVQPNTELDKEARSRCTSYYPPLTKRCEEASSSGDNSEDFGNAKACVPMLPPQLSENFCSLLPETDRLTVSVFITLNENGEIVDEPEIRRSMVRSRCRLDYAIVQCIVTGTVGKLVEKVADSVKEDVLLLNALAQKRRRKRLGDAALSRLVDPEEDTAEAQELVEEMMILANMTVAKCLQESMPRIAPLRVQLPPKDLRVQEWLQRDENIIDCSLSLPSSMKHAKVTSRCSSEESEKKHIILQEHIWSAICKSTRDGDIQRVERLLCDEKNHPRLAVAISRWKRIQSKSQYVCGGEQLSEQICHASLGEREHPYYTHFTSPIRRYIDILVHRLLIILLSHDADVSERYPPEDVSRLCRRSTFFSENSRKFDKECKRVVLASQLAKRSHIARIFVDTIDDRSITLHMADPEYDHLSSKQKRLQFSHMGPVVKVETEERGEGATVRWRIRAYNAPAKCDVEQMKEVFSAVSTGTGTIHLQKEVWKEILGAVKAQDRDELSQIITKSHNCQTSSTDQADTDFR